MKERKGEGGQTGVNLLTLFWFSLSRLYSICCGIQTHPLLFYTDFHLNFRLGPIFKKAVCILETLLSEIVVV